MTCINNVKNILVWGGCGKIPTMKSKSARRKGSTVSVLGHHQVLGFSVKP